LHLINILINIEVLLNKTIMKKYYLTFGQTHTHSVGGFTYDKDVVCIIRESSENKARKIAFEAFGDKWFSTYKEKPDMRFFPRGTHTLN